MTKTKTIRTYYRFMSLSANQEKLTQIIIDPNHYTSKMVDFNVQSTNCNFIKRGRVSPAPWVFCERI